MDVCSDDHDAIAYEGRRCPLCDVKQELESKLDESEQLVSDLESKLQDAEESYETLSKELETLKNDFEIQADNLAEALRESKSQ